MSKAKFDPNHSRHVSFLRIPEGLKQRIRELPRQVHDNHMTMEYLACQAFGRAHDKYLPGEEDGRYTVWTFAAAGQEAIVSVLVQEKRITRFTIEYDVRNAFISEVIKLTESIVSKLEKVLETHSKKQKHEVQI